MALTRMDLADIGNPDDLAKAIFEMWPDMPIPVPVEQVAAELDISDIEELTTDGFVGALVTDTARSFGAILVASGMHNVRRRFTIGHELGHFLCPWHKPRHGDRFLCSTADMVNASTARRDAAQRMEVEANRFAAGLLLPEKSFLQNIRKKSGPDIEHILELAIKYDTSKEATARRYAELHDGPCGVVISQNGKVLRFYKNPDFPWIEPYRKGSPIPNGSMSAAKDQPIGLVSDIREIPAEVWFPSGPGEIGPNTYEQTLPQRNGYLLTLLTVDEDEEELDEEIEEAWTPRY